MWRFYFLLIFFLREKKKRNGLLSRIFFSKRLSLSDVIECIIYLGHLV